MAWDRYFCVPQNPFINVSILEKSFIYKLFVLKVISTIDKGFFFLFFFLKINYDIIVKCHYLSVIDTDIQWHFSVFGLFWYIWNQPFKILYKLNN